MKVHVFLLVAILTFVLVMPVYAAQEVPGTPVDLIKLIGSLLAGICLGSVSMLIQVLLQKLIPYLGQETADKLSGSLNTLGALLIPVGVAYGLSYLANVSLGLTMDPWEFAVFLMAGIAGGQGFYEFRSRRK